ncbi:hypothetical protein ACA910_013457 [Epithemia clementina (nom. ined.)]
MNDPQSTSSTSSAILPTLEFVDSVLFPFNYSFVDQNTGTLKILREVSACRFLADSNDSGPDNTGNGSDSHRLLLVGDSGEIFHAILTLWAEEEQQDDNDNDNNGKTQSSQKLRFNITMERQVPLLLPGFNVNENNDGNSNGNEETTNPTPQVDAEGCEVFEDKFPHLLLISSELPLALNWFNPRTGWATTRTTTPSSSSSSQQQQQQTLPSFQIPKYITNRTLFNKGFEAVTAWSSPRMPSTVLDNHDDMAASTHNFYSDSYVLTTTEGHIQNDPPGFHRWLIWNTDKGGDPILEMGHYASRWKEVDGDHNEFLSINDMTYWPEQELLFVLERGYDGNTNMIHLSTVDLTFPMTRRSHSLMTWTHDTMFLSSPSSSAPPPTTTTASSTGSRTEAIKLQVDNYESLCLLPPGATIGRENNHNRNEQRLLLLVNDENQNPKQIGTQFVLLRVRAVPTDADDKNQSVNNNNSNAKTNLVAITSSVTFIVGFVSFMLLILVARGICWWRYGRNRRLSNNNNTNVQYQPASVAAAKDSPCPGLEGEGEQGDNWNDHHRENGVEMT